MTEGREKEFPSASLFSLPLPELRGGGAPGSGRRAGHEARLLVGAPHLAREVVAGVPAPGRVVTVDGAASLVAYGFGRERLHRQVVQVQIQLAHLRLLWQRVPVCVSTNVCKNDAGMSPPEQTCVTHACGGQAPRGMGRRSRPRTSTHATPRQS